MASFDQVTAGLGWPSALQLRLTVVPALTLIVPGPLVSRILADSEDKGVRDNKKSRSWKTKINVYNTPGQA